MGKVKHDVFVNEVYPIDFKPCALLVNVTACIQGRQLTHFLT